MERGLASAPLAEAAEDPQSLKGKIRRRALRGPPVGLLQERILSSCGSHTTILGVSCLLPVGSRDGTRVATIVQQGLVPAESTSWPSFYIKIHITSPRPRFALSTQMVFYRLEIMLKTTKCKVLILT